MIRLGIFFGGKSGEHEISCLSAASVIRAVDRKKYEPVQIGITREGKWLVYDGPAEHIEDGSWQEEAEAALAADPGKYGLVVLGAGGQSLKSRIDFALPIMHGTFGEDGKIQGLFEMAGIPYGGCGVMGSSLAMDKILAKAVFAQNKLPQCGYYHFIVEEYRKEPELWLSRVEAELEYPVFVKPANLGSSVGISKADNREALERAIDTAALYDRRILIEQGLECREIEVGVLGNADPRASEVGEIVLPSESYYDYDAKYLDTGSSILCIPAENLSSEERDVIRSLAVKAYSALDCCGFARVDFFMGKKDRKIYLNEINTIPGFTRFSMFPGLWGAVGVEYPDLLERIIALGYERYYDEDRRKTDR